MGAGRQRTFDKEKALHEAMKVFWQKGFSGASLSDLTEAMGINKPSLYAAFGNKEKLFISAINQYVSRHGIPHFDKLLNKDSNLHERLEAYLKSVAEFLSDSKLPGGCFVTNSTCEVGSNCLPEAARQTILEINKASASAFINFFKDEQAKGNIASKAKPEVLSDYLLAIQFGLAVMARNGVTQNQLDQVIKQAIATF